MAVRVALGEEIAHLRTAAPDVGWVAPDNLHLTLKFLGPVAPGRIDQVEGALARVARGVRPFLLLIRGLGAFPTPPRPRVIWAGAAAGGEALSALAGQVDDAVAALGFERETRAYSPHVTLGRVRASRRDPALAAAIEGGAAREFGLVHVNKLHLMRSDLSPRGARYTSLGAWSIGTAQI